ncbi:M14 family metallopeptidase [Budvicia aquatica]|uniref:Peptidase M14 n=1 Tax=Budvicia aquatica TaxID=82979 RepID=A0A2C6DT27_9GAMM|nr:M14 family metallocarboxypeptidase [Budvicia aquatica]PHI32357.1 peptidase M14 [Budvicia aquatica]VFS45337.1 Zinc carboxypeptidase [Budvicia aquatica]
MKCLSRAATALLFPCLVSLFISPITALAKYDPAKNYQEIPAIVKQFPVPNVDMGTPALVKDKTDFTSQKEMETFIDELSKKSPSLQVRIIGQSQQGRDIPLLVFSDSHSPASAVLLKNTKPTVLIIALQHGNEPASGEAALAYAKSLADGKEGNVLSRVNVLIIPRANPDGAENFTRDLANGINLNRDHLLLSTPESRAIAGVLNQYQPDVVLDSHEYSVAGRWVEKFGALQRYDAMLQYATTVNLPARLTKMSDKPFRDSIITTLETSGLSNSWYFTTDKNDMKDKTLSMGGIGADTFRNIAGLRNSVSFLLETRGVGLGKAHFARRVYTQLISMQALVKTAAKNSEDLTAMGKEIRADIAQQAGQGAIVVEGKATIEKHTISMIDAKTADGKKVDTDWRSSLSIAPVITRSRPYAYVLAPTEKKAAKKLQELGVDVYTVSQPVTIKTQQYNLLERNDANKKDVTGSVGKAGNQMIGVKTSQSDKELELTEGYYYIPLEQPLANLIIAALEPETQSSFIANGILSLPAKPKAVTKKKAKDKAKAETVLPVLPLYRVQERPQVSLVLMQ